MHHRLVTCALALATLAVSAVACEAEGDPADVDSARAGWRSAEVALGEAGIQTAWSGSATVDANGVSAMVTGTVACPEGGSLEIQSAGSVTDNLVTGEVEIEFDGCGADGVVIDGYLEYGGEVTDTKVSASFSGDLSFSGAAEGTCAVDLEATVTTDGVSVGGSAVGGHICGFTASELWG